MIEDVLVEIRTAVNTFLPAALNVEDAEYAVADAAEFGHALVLDDIVTVRFEEAGELEIQNYPALFLLPRADDHDPIFTINEFISHQVDCVVVIKDTDPVELTRRLFRTVEALRRVLTERVEGTGVSEDPVFQVDIARSDYSPTFELEGGGLVKSAVLEARFMEIEARP